MYFIDVSSEDSIMVFIVKAQENKQTKLVNKVESRLGYSLLSVQFTQLSIAAINWSSFVKITSILDLTSCRHYKHF